MIGIPLMLFGFIHNALIYYLSPVIARRISKEYEYQGPIAMTAGMVLGLILFPLCGWGMYEITENVLISLGYTISIPLSGLITYGFYKQFDLLQSQWKFMILFYRKKKQIAEIIMDKHEVMTQLAKYSLK